MKVPLCECVCVCVCLAHYHTIKWLPHSGREKKKIYWGISATRVENYSYNTLMEIIIIITNYQIWWLHP